MKMTQVTSSTRAPCGTGDPGVWWVAGVEVTLGDPLKHCTEERT